MAQIMTHRGRTTAVWAPHAPRSISVCGGARPATLRAFARFGGFNANSNHAPSGREAAITTDHGLRLLRRIAGAG